MLALSLEDSIEELQKVQKKLEEQCLRGEKIDLDILFKAAETSQDILTRLYDRADIKNNTNLHLFLKKMSDITQPLLSLSEKDLQDMPPASNILKKISAAFDNFRAGLERFVSKDDLNILRDVIGFVPLLEN